LRCVSGDKYRGIVRISQGEDGLDTFSHDDGMRNNIWVFSLDRVVVGAHSRDCLLRVWRGKKRSLSESASATYLSSASLVASWILSWPVGIAAYKMTDELPLQRSAKARGASPR